MTVENALAFATGPLFRFCFAIMIMGTIRLLWTATTGIVQAPGVKGDTREYTAAMRDTAAWMFPVRRIAGTRPLFSTISLVFHLGMLAIILFHQDHLLVLGNIAGIPWPSLPRDIADVLAGTSLLSGFFLLGFRIFNKTSRALSGAADYALLAAVVATLSTGFTASRAWWPFPHDVSTLCHVLLGNMILLLLPFTNLSHAVLYPLLRLATVAAWRLPSRTRR